MRGHLALRHTDLINWTAIVVYTIPFTSGDSPHNLKVTFLVNNVNIFVSPFGRSYMFESCSRISFFTQDDNFLHIPCSQTFLQLGRQGNSIVCHFASLSYTFLGFVKYWTQATRNKNISAN